MNHSRNRNNQALMPKRRSWFSFVTVKRWSEPFTISKHRRATAALMRGVCVTQAGVSRYVHELL